MTQKIIWALVIAGAFFVGTAVSGTLMPNLIAEAVSPAVEGWQGQFLFYTTCPAGFIQSGSWCIDPAPQPIVFWSAAATGCIAKNLELVPANVLAQAALGGFAPGFSIWSSDIGNDPDSTGPFSLGKITATAVQMTNPPQVQEFIGFGFGYLCGKPLLV